MPFRALLFISLLLTFACSAQGQLESVPFDSSRWEIDATESRVEDYLGRKSLSLRGGLAVVKDSKFTDGILEFDMAFSERPNFVGAIWRLVDVKNHEQFYLRPHRSGNPDANQYQPVLNGVDNFQLYYGERYAVPTKYDFNQWLHIKIVVSGKYADIYMKDMDTPALSVELKRESREGRVGIFDATDTPAHFSNFSFLNTNTVRLKGTPKKPESLTPGTVMAWQVSTPFSEKLLEHKYVIDPVDWQKLTWHKLSCEDAGLANLARLAGLENGNTVFAKLQINSDIEQVKQLRFAFSDRIKVYFNGRLIYAGNDNFASRDYRFVGSIGLFDELYLPLVKGDNQLWMAVSENFGGWGIKAVFENMDGIRITDP